MRAKRAKSYRKAMQFYQQVFGFREPYQILVSPDFILAGVSKQLPVKERLEEAVQGQAKFLVTHCGISEILKSSSDFRAQAIASSKEFEKRRCPHQDPVSGLECIREIMGKENKNNYCVAVQDDELRARLRAIPGVPILHVKQSVVVLEPKSQVAQDVGRQKEREKLRLPELETNMIKAYKKQKKDAKDSGRKKKKVAGPKGPNPLSIKKPAKKAQTPKTTTAKALPHAPPTSSVDHNNAPPAVCAAGTKRVRTESSNSAPAEKAPATLTDPETSNVGDGGAKRKRKRKRPNKGGASAINSASAPE